MSPHACFCRSKRISAPPFNLGRRLPAEPLGGGGVEDPPPRSLPKAHTADASLPDVNCKPFGGPPTQPLTRGAKQWTMDPGPPIPEHLILDLDPDTSKQALSVAVLS